MTTETNLLSLVLLLCTVFAAGLATTLNIMGYPLFAVIAMLAALYSSNALGELYGSSMQAMQQMKKPNPYDIDPKPLAGGRWVMASLPSGAGKRTLSFALYCKQNKFDYLFNV